MSVDSLIDELTKDAAEGAKVKKCPKPCAMFIGWVVSIIAYVAISIFFFGYRDDLFSKLLEMEFLAEILVVIISITLSGWAANLHAYPDLSTKNSVKYFPRVALLIFIVVMVFGTVKFILDGGIDAADGMACAMEICIFSAFPALLLFMILSKGYCLNKKGFALSAGITVSLTAYLCLRFIEQTDNYLHLMMFHVFPTILVILLFSRFSIAINNIVKKMSKNNA